MPGWGLTTEQRKTHPWGLPPQVLTPGKVVTDPVHGDVDLTWLEVAIMDSPPFQRLRRVRQLGTTHLVYPGATHTRFSHSLGAVRVVQSLLDQVLTQSEGLHATPDLIAQWRNQDSEDTLRKKLSEASVLARLGALLHDLCHVPVGHSVEDDLQILVPHDENEARFTELWSIVREAVRRRAESTPWSDADGAAIAHAVDRSLFDTDGELHRELRPLILSKAAPVVEPSEMKYPFVADLVGNTICADLLDYLVRDHYFAGLPAVLGDRFISAFFIVPAGRGPLSRRAALNIQRQEHERPDIVSELLKALRYRYELTERALYHHAKLSADAMLGEALERWSGALWLQAAAEDIEALENHERYLAAASPYPLRRLLRDKSTDRAEAVEAVVRDTLETEFRNRGDDGMLEHIATLGGLNMETGVATDAARRLLSHSASLAQALLDRDLFRIAGRVGFKDTSADALYSTFGDAEARDRLERGAERFAELGGLGDSSAPGAPQVAIWLPKSGMRLKHAKVLVQHNAGIAPFIEYEGSRAQRGSDIYSAHERLWSCFVFVHRSLTREQERAVTTYLAGEMGVRWERHQEYGPRPEEWSTLLAIREVLGRDSDDTRERDLVDQLAETPARDTAGETLSSLQQRVRSIVDSGENP